MNGISVIIPTYKDDAALTTLLHILHTSSVDQIVIADAEKRQALPPDIIPDTLRVDYVHSQKGRGPQIKSAIARATQDYIWVLHADSQPHRNAPQSIRLALAAPQIALTFFTLCFDSPHIPLRLFSWFARWDSAISTFGDQGFAFRRTDYEALPLDLNHYPLMEDMALRSALKTRGRVKRLSLPLKTSARRFEKHGIWKTQYLNTQILWRFWRGETPQNLYQDYYKA